LHLLATSRQPLGVVGERTWRVPSLSLPEGNETNWATEKGAQSILLGSEAAQLFVERAVAAQPSFRLTRENLVSVARLCRLLDGIPLALELAAAWVRVMPVEQTLSRLGARLDLLQSRQPGRLPRHQTLRATLDWSYELLEEDERALLARLSVFVGGWSLTAAEAVCADKDEGGRKSRSDLDSDDPATSSFILHPSSLLEDGVLLGLAGLVDKSLVMYTEAEGAGRYQLLETTRQYAQEKLQQSGETRTMAVRHRDYFLALAEEIRPKLIGSTQGQWLAVLEAEHGNLREALTLTLKAAEGGDTALRLGAALQQFWIIRGHLSEGRDRWTAVLSHPGAQEPTKARAEALLGAGTLATMQGDYATARALIEESLTIARELGDRRGIANSLNNLGNMAAEQGDFTSARSLHEESLALRLENPIHSEHRFRLKVNTDSVSI
ncbi:MAG TPA: tetratricopeptide repeat protein, partial [Chthonomonadaceae bacterium]|nr:tetratricopeptide repeat protein [Chthonomonadaceae bacterium]